MFQMAAVHFEMDDGDPFKRSFPAVATFKARHKPLRMLTTVIQEPQINGSPCNQPQS